VLLTVAEVPRRFSYCSEYCDEEIAIIAWASHLFRHAKPHINLYDYLKGCVKEPRYHTSEYLTNCLSLLNLAYMEGRYLYTHDCHDICPRHSYHSPKKEGEKLTGSHPLGEVMHFNPVTKKVRDLHRMRKGVACCDCDNNEYDANGLDMYEQAEAYLEAKGDDNVLLREFLALPLRKKAMTTRTVDIIREHGRVVTHRPSSCDVFRNLIVTVGDKQYSIYAEEAKAFRDCCFIPRSYPSTFIKVGGITQAYILDSMHERNWATVTKSDRFRLTDALDT